MTILTALTTLYDRLEEAGEAPRRGYSEENIGCTIVLDADGNVVRFDSEMVPDDQGKKTRPKRLSVPAAVKRSSGIKPNLLWDKSAYALGITAVEVEDDVIAGGQGDRTLMEHNAFKDANIALLSTADDLGLCALRNFLESWRPDMFAKHDPPLETLDQNFVFRLDEGTTSGYIHERPAAIELIDKLETGGEDSLCLVSGKQAPIARLHPAIKGVWGAKSSGASVVSFNDNAYESFGKKQGTNAPVSNDAAAAYGAALNKLLEKGSGKNLIIGGTTVVFWAETPERATGRDIENLMMQGLDGEDENAATNTLRAELEAVAKGRASPGLKFDPETRIYILGLAPNAARLSVRFWYPGTFGDFARNVVRFWEDLRLEPSRWKSPPVAWSLLCETALQREAKNIPSRLAGELMRTVLTGAHYPRTLLATVIGRIRADGEINAQRAAICKAYIARNIAQEEIPVSLDIENPNPAYRLGRLFAVLENVQKSALSGLNATIKDRYFAAASATPARVFPMLVKNATHHLALMRKGDSGGLAYRLDEEMGTIWGGLDPDLPRSLNLEDQGRFVAGYYHQRWTRKDKNDGIDQQENQE